MSAAALGASPFESSEPPASGSAPSSRPAASHSIQQKQLLQQQQQQAKGLTGHASLVVAASQPQPPCMPNAHVLFGQASLAGTRYGSLNQDFVVTQQLHDSEHLVPHLYMTVVLDGHGMLGELAACEAGHAIAHALKHSELRHRQLADFLPNEVEALVKHAFDAGHTAALRVFDNAPPTYMFPLGSRYERRYTLQSHDNGDKVYYSQDTGARILEYGTTATLALVQGTTLVVADVDDSLAVLGREEDDSYEAEQVSVRHWGWDPGEQARLARECGKAVSILAEDGYLAVAEGRLRGFQLAMTRALGHRLLQHYGVASEPSVTFHRLRPEHTCLVAATDGVWEVLSPGAAVKLVADVMAEGRTAEEAATELCREAVAQASCSDCTRQLRGAADNTTAAVFVFAEL